MKKTILLAISLLVMANISQAQSLESYGVVVNNPNHIPIDTSAKDTDPQFKGGDAALHSYIVKHLRYPKNNKEAKMEGTVKVLFTVNYDGKISDIEILSTPNQSFAFEARRVIEKLPRFTKEKKGGPHATKTYVMPIDFKLNKN